MRSNHATEPSQVLHGGLSRALASFQAEVGFGDMAVVLLPTAGRTQFES